MNPRYFFVYFELLMAHFNAFQFLLFMKQPQFALLNINKGVSYLS